MTKDITTCINEGCNNLRATHVTWKNGTKKLRPMCSRCFRAARGLVNFADGVSQIKKDYCENRDGRLGVVCRATNLQGFQLDMDHIDGNGANNHPDNIQTLCKNCHALKTKQERNNVPPAVRKKSSKR